MTGRCRAPRARTTKIRLVAGPDVGETDLGRDIYLPAYRRYEGRFFVRLREADPAFWTKLDGSPVEILFVSGLYGLAFWNEPIQEYDCHMADYLETSRERLTEVWRDTLTRVLRDLIRNAAPRCVVYDLLSDALYQGAFDWRKIEGGGVQIRHRVFKGTTDPEVLYAVADTLARYFDLFDPNGPQFKRDGEYSLSYGPASYVAFEPTPGYSKLRETRDDLVASRPTFKSLQNAALDALALAELCWTNGMGITNFDLALVVVSFSKAVETYFRTCGWLECKEREVLKGIKALLTNRGKGELAKLVGDLDENFRKPASRGNDEKFDLKRVGDGRSLAFDIVEKAELSKPASRR